MNCRWCGRLADCDLYELCDYCQTDPEALEVYGPDEDDDESWF